jgi:hypothetical protein
VAAPAIILIAVCGLLPTIVVFALDWSEGQTTACTVGSMNVAGVVPFLPALLSTGPTAVNPTNLLGDTTALIVMYAAAAVGWLLVGFLPALFVVVEREELRQRSEHLRRVQARLEEEWGQEVGCSSFEPAIPQAISQTANVQKRPQGQ